MKLSPAAEFAIRGVLVLAQRHGQGPTTLDAICAERDLPKQYLVKIFASLTKAHLVTPVRGKKGGFLLAREPDNISLLDIVEAVEGPIVLNLCQQVPPQCDNTACPVRPIWAELQDFIRGKLSSVTLASCLSQAQVGQAVGSL
ncbi:MAG: Rrf2 family transcriptional regulator [Phycisphaerae bacterium]|jgi:Rrf2 family protein